MTKFESGLGNDNEVSDELYLVRMRYWRDTELARTDWTQVADAPVDQVAWATYRQALRDLPASNSDPRKIELPIAP
ncbi:Phage tail assembly chaperone protein [uncultured Caudovirales phage]|uniref:Phage tail assembly chaperone protein n=1 Tax=uncultured Caudovirales phage TaxID=2100421 RepID=A0A6J7WZ52_9CAUD|nr:Phage tail assembly chaperone protein [uncultured Caudovirales phage]